ncbi:MAG TPA: hypothetical protein VIB48_15200 [Acidimicrobiia bacterium]|jgi:hypothetical protein
MLAVVHFTVDGLAHAVAQALGIELGRFGDALLLIAALVVWASLPDPVRAARDARIDAPIDAPSDRPVVSRTGS